MNVGESLPIVLYLGHDRVFLDKMTVLLSSTNVHRKDLRPGSSSQLQILHHSLSWFLTGGRDTRHLSEITFNSGSRGVRLILVPTRRWLGSLHVLSPVLPTPSRVLLAPTPLDVSSPFVSLSTGRRRSGIKVRSGLLVCPVNRSPSFPRQGLTDPRARVKFRFWLWTPYYEKCPKENGDDSCFPCRSTTTFV